MCDSTFFKQQRTHCIYGCRCRLDQPWWLPTCCWAKVGLYLIMLNICPHSLVVCWCFIPAAVGEADGGSQSSPATTSGTMSVFTGSATLLFHWSPKNILNPLLFLSSPTSNSAISTFTFIFFELLLNHFFLPCQGEKSWPEVPVLSEPNPEAVEEALWTQSFGLAPGVFLLQADWGQHHLWFRQKPLVWPSPGTECWKKENYSFEEKNVQYSGNLQK